MTLTHPYDALTPDLILDAVETYGRRCTGALLALNSYENRVYRVETESDGLLVAKFYRPGRWSDAAILEEHAFTTLLAEHEIPVVAPMTHQGRTLNRHAGFRFALFPWQPGRAPELNHDEDYEILGRFLGRLHRFGRAEPFRHRPRIGVQEFGRDAVTFLRTSGFVPDDLEEAFLSLAQQVLQVLEEIFATFSDVVQLRLHGDCHLGNILWRETGPYFVDFDDCRTGPAVQDLWMLLAGDRADMEAQLGPLLTGYTRFMEFNVAELSLIEPLRTLRLLHYNAWIGTRWDDPAFPRAFPWFATQRHWQELILALREQLALLHEPPLVWQPERF